MHLESSWIVEMINTKKTPRSIIDLSPNRDILEVSKNIEENVTWFPIMTTKNKYKYFKNKRTC